MAGLLSKSDMPNMNLAGILLGGRGYMADWFRQRDQLGLSEIQEQRRAQFAQGLLASPEMRAYRDNPDDPTAITNLWGQMQGGGAENAQLGASLWERGIGAHYGKDLATYQDVLQKGRQDYGLEIELKADQIKRERDKQAIASQFEVLTGDRTGQLQRNMAYEQFRKLPEGYDAVPDGGGGIALRPTPGLGPWREMTAELQPAQEVLSGFERLYEMAKPGSGATTADIQAQKLSLIDTLRVASKSGALDKDSLAFYNELIPGAWNDFSVNPTKWNATEEKLRFGIYRAQTDMRQVQQRWMLTPAQADALNVERPDDYPLPGNKQPTKPVPNYPANTRQKLLEEKASEAPGPSGGARTREMRGRQGSSAPSAAPSIWDYDPSDTPRIRARKGIK